MIHGASCECLCVYGHARGRVCRRRYSADTPHSGLNGGNTGRDASGELDATRADDASCPRPICRFAVTVLSAVPAVGRAAAKASLAGRPEAETGKSRTTITRDINGIAGVLPRLAATAVVGDALALVLLAFFFRFLPWQMPEQQRPFLPRHFPPILTQPNSFSFGFFLCFCFFLALASPGPTRVSRAASPPPSTPRAVRRAMWRCSERASVSKPAASMRRPFLLLHRAEHQEHSWRWHWAISPERPYAAGARQAVSLMPPQPGQTAQAPPAPQSASFWQSLQVPIKAQKLARPVV